MGSPLGLSSLIALFKFSNHRYIRDHPVKRRYSTKSRNLCSPRWMDTASVYSRQLSHRMIVCPSCVDWVWVCVFFCLSLSRYGQTGSGKTYTMEGEAWEAVERAGYPFSITVEIFSVTIELSPKTENYRIRADSS